MRLIIFFKKENGNKVAINPDSVCFIEPFNGSPTSTTICTGSEHDITVNKTFEDVYKILTN